MILYFCHFRRCSASTRPRSAPRDVLPPRPIQGLKLVSGIDLGDLLTKSAPTPYEQASMSAAAPGVTVFLTALFSHAHTSSNLRRDFLRMLSLLLRHIQRLVIMASIDLGDFRIPPRGPEACSASRPVTSSSMRETAASRSTQPGTPCRSVIQFDSAHSQRPSMSASVSVPASRIATAGRPRQPVRLLEVHRVQGSVEDELDVDQRSWYGCCVLWFDQGP